MTANSKLTLTEAKIANHKLCLFVSTLLSFAINLLMLITIARGGFGFGYILLPLLICLIDVAFVVVAAFTNFRFAYSTLYTTVFSLIYAATTLIFALVLLNIGNGTAITLVAFLLGIICSVFSIAVIILGASRAGKNHGAIKSAVALAILLVSIGAYTVSLISNGFFGQGNEKLQRPVSFVYDSEKEYYIATEIMSGRGKTAVIPETFNDVKVGAIDCSLFLDSKIKTVSIMTAADVEFTNTEALTAGVPDIECLASKDLISAYASTLYDLVKDKSAKSNAICTLVSKFVPSDLSGDEIYVTFTYSPESIICAGGEYIPVWIGNKNDVFSFGYAEGCDYLTYSNINNESVLSAIYNKNLFNGGNVLSTVTLPSGTPLVGQTMTESVDNVEIKFEKVYRVKILDDNDGLYEIENSFRYLNNLTDRYRYVTAGTADSLLSKVAAREGFTLAWKYSTYKFQKLSDVINESVDEYSLTPIWTLNAPTFTSFKTNTNDTSFVYGDNMSFDFNVEKPTANTELEYAWYKDGQKISDIRDFSIDKILMGDAGHYKLEITATTPTTSLTSKATNDVDITVGKKELNINWVGFGGGESFSKTYDSEDFAPEIVYNSSEFVFSTDETAFAYYFGYSNLKGAGEYNVEAFISGECADKYVLSQTRKLYTINKKEVDIEWSNTPIYYNATSQIPGVNIISGIMGDDFVYATTLEYSNVNAGEYTVKAVLDGTASANYALKPAQISYEYKILPATIDINWSNVSQIYQGKRISPTVIPTGLCGEDTAAGLNLKVTDAKDAGIHEITASINNSNYVIRSGDEKTSFEILPASLTVSFSNTTQTYNSGVLKPTYTVKGLCESDTVAGLGLSIEGRTNVGVYELTLTHTNNNYILSNPTISNFKINPATIKVTWNTNTNLTYNGAEQHLGIYKVEGIYNADKSSVSVKVNAGTSSKIYCGTGYVAYAEIQDTNALGNYVISNDTQSHEYSIVQATLQLTWTDLTFTYNKTSQIPKATLATKLFGNDSVNIIVEGAQTEAGENYIAEATIIGNDNYKLSNPTAKFTINPKEIEVTWSNLSFTYDKTSKVPTATLSSEVFGNDVVNISVSGAKTNAGTYTATASSSNSNYKVSNSTNKFTISPKEITISWGNTSFVYNGSNQHPTATADGLVSGDSDVFTYTGVQKKAGTHTATVALKNANYTFKAGTATTQSYTIAQREITITWNNNTSFVYNGSNQHPTATVSDGLVSGDSVTFTYTGSQKNVGTYSAKAVSANSNYKVSEACATKSFTITPKTITVTWTGLTQTYTGGMLKPTATLSGVIAGDNVTLTITVGGAAGKVAVGTYTAEATINNNNYVLDTRTRTATFTIVAAQTNGKQSSGKKG